VDGNFNGTRENATSTINTSNLNSGNYNIEVRGMAGGPEQNPLIRYYPINGDISTTKNTTLTIESQNGFINGRITNRSGGSIPGAIVSILSIPGKRTTSAVDGTYLLSVPPGAYNVTASNQPTHTDNTTYDVPVTALNITYANITLDTKLTGTIIGVVTNV
ncbi:MAG: carboxypeptidase-like regulatory domain-containing protein, partial [Euryarchaeota archaeon]|nr:carboxypeptidase-like regulatory domain-containing protein [Euryarchaeota archaeon]